MKFGVGQPVTRFEDTRLLRGRGRFQDDVNVPHQAYCVFVRSPHAHAKIQSINTDAAAAAPNVIAVYTGKDYAADGLGMPKANMPRKKADGSPMFAPQRPALMHSTSVVPAPMKGSRTVSPGSDASEINHRIHFSGFGHGCSLGSAVANDVMHVGYRPLPGRVP